MSLETKHSGAAVTAEKLIKFKILLSLSTHVKTKTNNNHNNSIINSSHVLTSLLFMETFLSSLTTGHCLVFTNTFYGDMKSAVNCDKSGCFMGENHKHCIYTVQIYKKMYACLLVTHPEADMTLIDLSLY